MKRLPAHLLAPAGTENSPQNVLGKGGDHGILAGSTQGGALWKTSKNPMIATLSQHVLRPRALLEEVIGMSRPKLGAAFVALLLVSGLASACAGNSGSDGRTRVEFFQFKGEAVETFDRLIAQFEKEHPGIDIVQNNVPSADAALRTRLVKNNVPPLMTLNGNGATYGDLAEAAIFRDFSDDPALANITPASVHVLNSLGTAGEGETNGVPFAANADGIIYNVDLFDELELIVPTTWGELIAVAEKIKAAGLVPFYHTWKEAWTTLPPFNPLAQNVVPEDFWAGREAGETSFAEAFPPVAERLLSLKGYGPADPFRFDYNTGNRAMADGEAVMYLQGIWAIPSIRAINPDINLAVFPFPTTNDPERNRLVSGVDVLLTMPREKTDVEEEALTFIRWLTQPGPAKQYAEEQAHFSAVEGVVQDDPALAPLNPVFEAGHIVGFADHNIPSAIPLANLLQGFLINGDVQRFLAELDKRYDAVQARRG
jgi:raffinose/stachyose/melibiose transport system substrate-binding protein